MKKAGHFNSMLDLLYHKTNGSQKKMAFAIEVKH